MYAYDFEYDGRLLSDLGMIVCDFSSSSGASNADKGSEIKFNMEPVGYGRRFLAQGMQYENCLSTTFQICKDPRVFPEEEMLISNEEFRALSRWLNRKKFLWFRSFDLCEPEKEKPWFRASFNLTRIESGRDTVGVELSMMTDSPFGYGPEEEIELNFVSGALSAKLIDTSDETGDIYPWMKVTCGQSGTLTLSNSLTLCATQITGCVSGEILTFSGESMIVSSSNTNHDLANTFNYDFFRIGNTADNRENVITASMPCGVELKYRPIWKDTL